MAEDNVALVRRWFDQVWNKRRAEVIDELVAADSVCYADDGPMRGPAEFRARQYDPFLAAFPDLRVEVEAVVSQGDQVVVRWAATGRHTGGGLGFPATDEVAAFRGMSWIRVAVGKFAEGWQVSNIPEVVRGLAAGART
jgi:steroid delta-isomerase-like uncharacterized protein